MSVEALALTSEPHIGLAPRPFHPHPNYAAIPEHLIDATGALGRERGTFVEKRVKSLIEAQPNVVEVIHHPGGSEEDQMGRDLTVRFDEQSPVSELYVQVKASKYGIADFKRDLRRKNPQIHATTDEEKQKAVQALMTNQKIILINGSQTKSDWDIIEDSYIPQRNRIFAHEIGKKTSSSEAIQIFPEASGQ